MTFVSVTRLRIRSWRFMPGFALQTGGAIRQARRAGGYRSGSLLRDRKLTFWTMTLWDRQQDMRAYIASGPHLKAMPKLLDWCDEASIVHWTQNNDTPPSWLAADARMRAEGRPSKVRNPSPVQARMEFDAPQSTQGFAINPQR